MKKSLFGILALSLTAGALAGPIGPNGYTLSWSDEFKQVIGSAPNPQTWGYNIGNNGWGNNELENYTNLLDNSHIVVDPLATDGYALQITALKTANGYTSARLISIGKVTPTYGFVEARIRMPYGQGIWPAFWMLGNNINSVGWPKCGEVDIMENIGNHVDTNWGSFHAPGFDASQTFTLKSPTVYNTGYHLFQASWSPNCITLYVDGQPYHTENINNDATWPFNAAMFFILNVAVGGSWPGSPDATTKFPQKMLVDYVRVYHLTGPTSNQVVSFFASANNKYISAEDAGASPLDCNRTVAQSWEQFVVDDLGNNRVALQSVINNKFVTVASDGSLIANASKASAASAFNWLPSTGGTVYLQSVATGKYVTVNTKANPPSVTATGTSAGTAQRLGVTCYATKAVPGTPAAPTQLTAAASATSVTLNWANVSGATSYQVYRSTLPGGSGMAPLTTVTSPTALDTNLTKGRTYYYTVTALNAQGMSLRSSVVSATLTGP